MLFRSPALGNWDINGGVPLDASEYTSENPLWRGTVFLDAAKEGSKNEVKYHYIRQQGDKWVKETVERKVEVGSCDSGTVSTEDKWTGPIVARKHDSSGGSESGSGSGSTTTGHSSGVGASGSGDGADGKDDGKGRSCPVLKCPAPKDTKHTKDKIPVCLMPDGKPIPKHALEDITNKLKHPTKELPLSPLKSKKGLKKRLECLVE